VPKLFIVTRADLTPAQQAVQAAHAALEFAIVHPQALSSWGTATGHLVLCAAPDELTLCWLIEEARHQPVLYAAFYEPDLDGALTAVAFNNAGRKLASEYPLALQGEKP
jgi:hypothetical protein